MQSLIDLFVGLIPPKDNDPVKLYGWQWRSVFLGAVCLGLGIYASDLIPGIHPDYALASSVETKDKDLHDQFNDLKGEVSKQSNQILGLIQSSKEIQKRGLTTDLLEATRYKCVIEPPGAPADARSFWTRRLQDLKLAYLELTGESWPDVPCSSF